MRIAPTQVTGTDWTAVSAGFYHTCALKTDGTLWCWGDNTSGQLGLGTASTTPGQVTAGTAPWTVVTAGQSHTCALQADGTLWCWGENADGQLGIGSNLPSAAPVVVTASPSSWSAVAAGGAHTCAVAGDGTLWCWGANVKGQLGIGSVASQVVPARLGS
jgi:alpha-tubulin suppressor-like RCC1 family protein